MKVEGTGGSGGLREGDAYKWVPLKAEAFCRKNTAFKSLDRRAATFTAGNGRGVKNVFIPQVLPLSAPYCLLLDRIRIGNCVT
jgi:hypothetical protein